MECSDDKRRIEELVKIVDELPEEVQLAFYAVIKRIRVVEEMCKDPGMTREELEREIKEEIETRKDYTNLAMLCFALSYMDNEAQQRPEDRC